MFCRDSMPFIADIQKYSIECIRNKNGENKIKISLFCFSVDKLAPQGGFYVNEYLDFDGKGYYFAAKSWRLLSGVDEPPVSYREARLRLDELKIPRKVWLRKNDKYINVHHWYTFDKLREQSELKNYKN